MADSPAAGCGLVGAIASAALTASAIRLSSRGDVERRNAGNSSASSRSACASTAAANVANLPMNSG